MPRLGRSQLPSRSDCKALAGNEVESALSQLLPPGGVRGRSLLIPGVGEWAIAEEDSERDDSNVARAAVRGDGDLMQKGSPQPAAAACARAAKGTGSFLVFDVVAFA